MFSDIFSVFENVVEEMSQSLFCRILILIQFVCILLLFIRAVLSVLINFCTGRRRRRKPKNKEEEEEEEEDSLTSPNMD